LKKYIDNIIDYTLENKKLSDHEIEQIKSDDESFKYFFKIFSSLKKVSANNIDNSDIANVWKRIDNNSKRKKQKIKLLSYAAASIIIVLLGIFTIYEYNHISDVHYQCSNNDKIKTLYLEDGSTVYLKPNSDLVIPADFSAKNRNVYLNDGEAYFEVNHKTVSKFKVHSNGYEVEVLGTKFNIRAKEKENIITTSLKEGKVRVNYENQKLATLQPNMKLTFFKRKGTFKIDKYSNELQFSFKDNMLLFENVKLKKVLSNLAIHYNKKIIFKGNDFNSKISGTFNNEKLLYVLKILNKLEDFNFQLDKNTIIITKNN
jgi:ferric-dicitrate binding protein FerR (iron transport regulator)